MPPPVFVPQRHAFEPRNEHSPRRQRKELPESPVIRRQFSDASPPAAKGTPAPDDRPEINLVALHRICVFTKAGEAAIVRELDRTDLRPATEAHLFVQVGLIAWRCRSEYRGATCLLTILTDRISPVHSTRESDPRHNQHREGINRGRPLLRLRPSPFESLRTGLVRTTANAEHSRTASEPPRLVKCLRVKRRRLPPGPGWGPTTSRVQPADNDPPTTRPRMGPNYVEGATR